MTVTETPTETQTIDGMIMWPCEIPLLNDLRRGDVVESAEDPTDHRVVTSDPTTRRGLRFVPMFDQDVEMVTPGGGHGSVRISDNHDRHWTLIPEDRQTAVERVHSAQLRFKQPPALRETSLDTDATGNLFLADDEMLPWHLLFALLPPGHAYVLTDGRNEWPGNYELAIAVAEHIDRRDQAHVGKAAKQRQEGQ